MDDDQLVAIGWEIFTSTGDGGALCFREDCYLITAYHVVGDNMKRKIKGRRSGDVSMMNIEYIARFPTLDIAILKVESPDPKKKFEYQSLTHQINIRMGEKLRTHRHETWITGWNSYKYHTSNDALEQLFDKETLSRTIENSSVSEMKKLRTETEHRPFRIAANFFGVHDLSSQPILDTNPYLPLIELDAITRPGFSGCPVFRAEDKLLVGVVIAGYIDSTFIVSVDVLYHAAVSHGLIEDENQRPGESSSDR